MDLSINNRARLSKNISYDVSISVIFCQNYPDNYDTTNCFEIVYANWFLITAVSHNDGTGFFNDLIESSNDEHFNWLYYF
jgi:hypothetical protein